MADLWFVLVWFMFATWVALGGGDLGVGLLQPFVARTEAQRRQVVDAIKPTWKANEVWLVAAGGTLLLAFPRALAVAFSGFYLPLTIVLWLIIVRALGIELRGHVDSPVWRRFWDSSLTFGSALMAACFGAAAGCLVRGVALDAEGKFFAPLWTDFRAVTGTGILDWYTVLVAVLAVAALGHHGARWLGRRANGDVLARARRTAALLGVATLGLGVVVTIATVRIQPALVESLSARPWGFVFPVAVVVGLVGAFLMQARGRARAAWRVSLVSIYGLVGGAAFTQYPFVLPGRPAWNGLTVHGAAADAASLGVALRWWVPGMLLVAVYFAVVYGRLEQEKPSLP